MSLVQLQVMWGQDENQRYLALAIIFPLLLIWGLWRRRLLLKRLGSFKVLANLMPHAKLWGPIVSMLMIVIAFVMMTLAYMQPQWGEKSRMMQSKALDIFLVQDISQSMLAQDVKPSRLMRSRHEIANFIDNLEGDRVGLIGFGGTTRLLCPLTQDYHAIKLFLRELDPKIVMQGTDLALAIQTTLGRFKDEQLQSQIMVILSDGEEHDAKALALAEQAQTRGVKVYTVGIGSTNGVEIPDPRRPGRSKLDSKGRPILTHLNEALLQEIASITGGKYFHASSGGFQLTKVLDEIRDIERDSIDDSEVIEYEQKYHYFLYVAGVLLILEWIFGGSFSFRRKVS